MELTQKWIDDYYISKDRIVLTYEQHKIPGIRTFGKQNVHNAIPPLALHYHENTFEFSLVSEGIFSFSTSNSTFKIYGGDVFISYPNEIHSTTDNPLTSGEFYWFQLDASDCDNLLFLKNDAAAHLIQRLQNIRHHVVNIGSKQMNLHIINTFKPAFSINDPHIIASGLTQFLYQLVFLAEKTQFHLTPDIGNVLSYILENITQNLSLDELATQCLLSTSQFKQKFKNQVGVSPRNFINQQKIETAKSMLAEGVSITDVAMQLGFDTSSYFSVVFKKYTTYTPSEYIKRELIK